MNISKFITKLLKEVSYRTKEGYPILSNREHIFILSEVLSEWGLDSIQSELIQNLLVEKGEVSTSAAKKAKDMGLNHIAFGFYSKTGEKPATHKADGENIVTVSADEFEKTAAEKSGETPANNTKDSNNGGDSAVGGETEPQTGTALSSDTEGGKSYLKSLPDNDPAKPADMKNDSEETMSAGGVVYPLGGGYYADTPNGKPKYREKTDEVINKTYFRYILEISDDEESTIVKIPANGDGETKELFVLDTDETKSAEFDTLSPADKIKFLQQRIEKDTEEFNNADNKDEVTLNLIKNRISEVNKNFMLPPGNTGSSFAENNGAYYINMLYNNNGILTKEDEKNILEYLLNTPLAKNIPEKDRIRWAKIAIDTAKSEANVLLKEKKYKAKNPQPTGMPQGAILDKQNKESIRRLFEYKLNEAKSSLDTKAIKHYETQLKFLNDLGETDTGVLYQTIDDFVGFKHTSNKSSFDDPHNNTSPGEIMSTINKILGDNVNPKVTDNFNLAQEKLGNASAGIPSDVQKFNEFRKGKSEADNKLENEIYISALKNFPIMGGKQKNYIGEITKSKWFKQYVKDNSLSEPYSDNDIMNAVFEIASKEDGSAGAQKIILKLSEMVEKVTAENLSSISKKFNISIDDMELIMNSAGVYFNQTAKSRRDVMGEVHTDIVSAIQEADAEDGNAYPRNPNGDNGIHQQAYVAGFLHRMHFDSYIKGERDGVASQNINGKNVEPEYYRNCLAELSGFDGDTSTDDGKKSLIEFLTKRVRISPKNDSIIFESKDGRVVTLGVDKYRTKGDSKAVLGSLGKDMKNCLKEKSRK
jgi:hypothetical protein